MTFYLHAYIVGGSVAHVHCCDVPISGTALEFDDPHIVVAAEVSGAYQDASVVFPLLGWDGSALTGLDFVSQEVIP